MCFSAPMQIYPKFQRKIPISIFQNEALVGNPLSDCPNHTNQLVNSIKAILASLN